MARIDPTEARGHRLLDEPGRRMITAWGPTMEICLAEAVIAATAGSGEPPPVPSTTVGVHVEPGSPAEMARELLSEVLELRSVLGMVAVAAVVATTQNGGLTCALDVSEARSAERRPARVARLELLSCVDGPLSWRCKVEVGLGGPE